VAWSPGPNDEFARRFVNRNVYVREGGCVATQPAPPTSGFRSVLRNRQYLAFLASSNTSTTGYSVYAISIVWLAYTVSHSFVAVGIVLFIESAAYTFTFLTGPIVDRVRNQRTIFVASYPIQAVAAALIAFGVWRGFLTVPLLYALVAVLAILWDMTWAAANAAPGVLLTKDEQFAAQGVAGVIGGALSILGFAVGGTLILVVGAEGGMLLYAVLLAAATVLALPLVISPPPSSDVSFLASFREGWKLVLGGEGRPLLQLASIDSVYGFLTWSAPILITVLAAESYHGSTLGYAALYTTDVVGGVVAGIVLGRWNPRGRVGVILAGALLLTGVAFVLAVALPAVLILGAITWFGIGFAAALYLDTKYAFYRGAVSPEKIGRLVSNMYVFPGIAGSVGALVISSVAAGATPFTLGVVIGIGFLAAGAVALALPGVRRMRY
jgi:hypothetical protein